MAPCPQQVGNRIRRIAHVVNLGDGDNRFARRSDFSDVLIPNIDDALLGNESWRFANRVILSLGNSLADTLAGPSRRQFFQQETRNFRYEGAGVGLRAN